MDVLEAIIEVIGQTLYSLADHIDDLEKRRWVKTVCRSLFALLLVGSGVFLAVMLFDEKSYTGAVIVAIITVVVALISGMIIVRCHKKHFVRNKPSP